MKKSVLKRLIPLLVAIMLLPLSACGKTSAPAEEPVPDVSPSQTAAEEPEPTLPPLPDVDIDSWEFILANSYNSITEYELGEFGGLGAQSMELKAHSAANDFLKAARAEGYEAYISVAYRNYEFLLNRYAEKIRRVGSAEKVAAEFLGPGVNEHQTGLALDFTDDMRYNATFDEYDPSGIEDTELYAWLCEHCSEYGFILRYPEGKEDYYGTPCQCAAHFRYVGKEAAKYITDNDLCFEEFLLLYDPDAVFVPDKD